MGIRLTLFREYKSIIPALSVRPRYDAVKVATASWWVLATLLFIIGDADYMSKEYGEGTAFLSVGFAMMFVNPAAAMYKNWDPSKTPKWSDLKADLARIKEEEKKKAEAAAARIKADRPPVGKSPAPPGQQHRQSLPP